MFSACYNFTEEAISEKVKWGSLTTLFLHLMVITMLFHYFNMLHILDIQVVTFLLFLQGIDKYTLYS